MRVRSAIWRAAGPAAGRLAPAAFRAYYRAVVGSLVRALLRTPDVVAVYAHGSYASGSLRPGQSDVDLDAVIEDLDPAREVEILVAVGRRYRPRQAALPIDITVLTRSEFPHDAGWIANRRRLIRTDEPIASLPGWVLLGGEELRTAPLRQPDGRHAYIREDYYVTPALADWPRSPAALARTVGRLAALAEREELDWPSALRLRAAAPKVARPDGARQALVAALELIEADRARHAVPLERRPDTLDWQLPQPADEPLAAARGLLPPVELRSATLYVEPLALEPTLLLEVQTPERSEPIFRWALERGARDARAAGIALEVVTSRLAEDSWRSGFRWVGLAGASRHLAGEPLAPRVRLPEHALLTELLDYRAFFAAETARSALVGLRTKRRTPSVLAQLALARDLLAGLPPTLPSPDAVSTQLDDRAWTQRAIELRRECAALLRGEGTSGAAAGRSGVP